MKGLYLFPDATKEVIESYDDDIIVTNRHGIIIKATRISGQHYGWSAEDLIGQSVYDLEAKGVFSPAITPLVLKQKKKVVRVQTTSSGRKMLITGIPFINEQDKVEYVLSHSYEVSELHALQNYLNELEGEMARMKSELAYLREISLDVDHLIAESQSMKDILKTVRKIAPYDVSVHIRGESGVGKATIAKLIHNQGTQKNGPFIEVNCGTIPSAILENELFGDPNDQKNQPGSFQLAEGGTLYLQGVDEMSLASQTTLMKGLSQRGGQFRVISSAKVNLTDHMAQQKFHKELYYFLHVVPIYIPPLRERLEDLGKIINIYMEKFTDLYTLNKTLSDELFQILLHMEWSGNYLEVKNLIERLVIQSDSVIVTTDDLPADYRNTVSQLNMFDIEGRTLPAILENVEKRVLMSAQKRFKTTTKMVKY